MTGKVEWTSPIIARLEELLAHNDSLSYKAIAEQMMKDFPGFKFTRNGISGKVWRMRLPPREKVVIKADGSQPRAPYITPPKRPKLDSFRTRCRKEFKFLELRTGQCKWPAGTGPYTFCGKPIVGEGAPYCARHSNIAYVKSKKVFA